MNCPKCNAEIPEKFKFCPECGTSVSTDSRLSGMETDRSVGDLRTVGAGLRDEAQSLGEMQASRDGVQSLGDVKTMQGAGDGASMLPAGVPLATRYELLEEIGRGGFARVWRAKDKRLGRIVAVKRLLSEMLRGAAGEQTLARFRRESQAIAQLNHRNIVGVYDHDRDAEGDYIVMEHVGGGTLRAYLKERGGKLPPDEAVALIRDIAQGLAYAHRKNLVHRDIKPANVLLAREGGGLVPKIVDFGLARVGSDSELSIDNAGMGTPYYMPPEQRRNAKNVNQTADVYALGKTLYELLTGEIPDQIDLAKVPSWLGAVIQKCVKNNPEDRYFSMDEVIGALAHPPRKRNVAPMAWMAGSALAAAFVVMLIWFLQAKPEADETRARGAAPAAPTPTELPPAPAGAPAPEVPVPTVPVPAPEGKPVPPSADRPAPGPAGVEATSPEQESNPLTLNFGVRRTGVRPQYEMFWNHEDNNAVKQYFCKLDGEDEYRPLGFHSQINPVTKMPYANPGLDDVEISEERPRRTLSIKYEDFQGQLHGPFDFDITIQDFLQGEDGGPSGPEAEISRRLETAQDEIRRGFKPGSREVHSALESGDLDRLKLYLANGADPNEKLAQSYPLRYALVGGASGLTLEKREKMVAILLEFGAKPTLETITIAERINAPQILEMLKQAKDGQPIGPSSDSGKSAVKDLQASGQSERELALKAREDAEKAKTDQWANIAWLEGERAWKEAENAAKPGGDLSAAIISWKLAAAKYREGLDKAKTAKVEKVIEVAKQAKASNDSARVRQLAQGILKLDAENKEAQELQQWADESDRAAEAVAVRKRAEEEAKGPPKPGRNWISPSTGMEFVWIPAMKMWVGKYEVTNGEYRKYKLDHSSDRWGNPAKGLNGDRQPVVCIRYKDALGYVEWMNDGESEQLGKLRYRFPSDGEWLTFAQCGTNRTYPWGDEWPPKYGNYSGGEFENLFGKIKGYNDGFPVSCPVEKSGENEWGIFGVGGNIAELVSKQDRPEISGGWRGASWDCSVKGTLKCRYPLHGSSFGSSHDCGLRLVLAPPLP